METRTYTERSNARRAARAAGLDPDTIVETEDGFEVRFAPLMDAVNDVMERKPSPIKQAVETAIERGLSPKQFVAEAEKVADALDGIPEFCKIAPEKRKESWIKNPPKVAAANLREAITMAKPKAKEKKAKGATGADKNATLLSMLKAGATVEALCDKLEWLPHTLRARISRLNKPKSRGGEGLTIQRAREDRITSYKIT